MPAGFQNYAGAQETDADHNIRDDSKKTAVSGYDIGKVLGRCSYEIRKRDGYYCEYGGAGGDKHCCSDAGFFADEFALQSDKRAQGEGNQKAQDHLFKSRHLDILLIVTYSIKAKFYEHRG